MVDAAMRDPVATEMSIVGVITRPAGTIIITMVMAGIEASTILDEGVGDLDLLAMDETAGTAGTHTAGGVPVLMEDLIKNPNSIFLGDMERMCLMFRSSYKLMSIAIL